MFDSDDKEKIDAELANHSHPLTVVSHAINNIVNHQVDPHQVNVQNALMISLWQKSLPSSFHAKVSSPVKIMEELTQGIRLSDKMLLPESHLSLSFDYR